MTDLVNVVFKMLLNAVLTSAKVLMVPCFVPTFCNSSVLSFVNLRNTGLEEMQVDHYNAEPDKLCTWLVYELADLCFPFFYRKHLFILLPTFSGIPPFAPNFQNFVTISVKKGTMCIAIIIKVGVGESILRAG